MSRIVYYKLVSFVFLFTFDAFLYAKLLRPSKDRDQKEILVINSKRRVYYRIKQTGITYQINVPTRIEFISRYPVLRKKKNYHHVKNINVKIAMQPGKVRKKRKYIHIMILHLMENIPS